ncbi:MAG: NUDIX hydrolase [bacterium]|nr:NUDIX hydrolase [bacterium]
MRRFKPLYHGRFLDVVQHHQTGFEVVRTTNSVAVLVYIIGEGLLLVKQRRPAMIRKGNRYGWITETVAGRRDRKLTLKHLASSEIREETGCAIKPKDIKILNGGKALALSPGALTERIWLAYAEIPRKRVSNRWNKIFGVDTDERTERVLVPLASLEKMKFTDMKTFAVVQWFLRSQTWKGA